MSRKDELIEQIIGERHALYPHGDYNSCGPDYMECPICGASERIIYDSGKQTNEITMSSLDHDVDCLYKLIGELEDLHYEEEVTK